jgi:hypothetical protein
MTLANQFRFSGGYMSYRWALLFLLPNVLLSVPSVGQNHTRQVVRRDLQALTVLEKAVNAGGGLRAIDEIQSFSASGRIIVYRTNNEGTEGDVTIKGRGLQDFRLDTRLDGVDEWWLIGKGGGFRNQAGTIRPLVYQEVANIRSFCLPEAQMARAIRDAATEVSFLGTTMRDKRPAFGVRIRVARNSPGPVSLGDNLLGRDFYIDGQTLQLISVEDVSYPMDRIADGIPRRVTFSDYRVVQGMPFPFSISEEVGHRQRLMTIHLTDVSMNVPLTDHDFEP